MQQKFFYNVLRCNTLAINCASFRICITWDGMNSTIIFYQYKKLERKLGNGMKISVTLVLFISLLDEDLVFVKSYPLKLL